MVLGWVSPFTHFITGGVNDSGLPFGFLSGQKSVSQKYTFSTPAYVTTFFFTLVKTISIYISIGIYLYRHALDIISFWLS